MTSSSEEIQLPSIELRPQTSDCPVRLLLIGGTPPPYHGVSIYTENLLEILERQDSINIVHIETSDKRSDLDNLGRIDTTNVVVALSAVARVIKYCLTFKPDVVYLPISQSAIPFFRDALFILIGKLTGAKVVVHLHGSGFEDFFQQATPVTKFLIDGVLGCLSGAIVLSNGLRKQFVRWLPEAKIFVLSNFVNAIQMPRRANLAKPAVISFLANIYEARGIFDLLSAVQRLKMITKVPFVLKVAGRFATDPYHGMSSNDCRTRFEKEVKALNGLVKYVGEIVDPQDKWQLLSETAVFVLPSWYEGQPLGMLEAMAAGCPVVSTRNTGAIEETITHGIDGLLVEKRNPGELMSALKLLLEDQELTERMGAAAHLSFERHHSWSSHLQSFQLIVHQLVQRQMILSPIDIPRV